MEIQTKLSKYGIPYTLASQTGATAGSVQVWFRAGSALEKGDDQGIAHFLEHMFFKGSKKRPGSKIVSDVEKFGGEINAFTSFDYTCYYINSPSDKTKESLEILLDMVANPSFLSKEIPPERDVVLEEYKKSYDSPNQKNFFYLQKKFFGGGYGHPILGSPKTIKSFQRKQITNFRKDHYNLQNVMLVISGDLENQKNRLEKTIDQFKLPNGPKSNFTNFQLKPSFEPNIQIMDTKMASLTFCYQAKGANDDLSIAEDIGLSCLTNGETSRFFKRFILKDPIANSVSGSTLFFNKGGVHFLKLAFPIESLDKILSELTEGIKELSMNPLTDSEVQKILNQYIASKSYEKESLESFSFSLGYGFALDKDIYFDDKFLEKVQRLDSVQVQKALVSLLNSKPKASLQLPDHIKKTEIAKYEKIIKDYISNFTAFSSPKAKQKQKIKAQRSRHDKSLQLLTLPSGAKLLHRHNAVAPTFVLQNYLKGGLSYENALNNGIGFLASQNLSKGSKRFSYHEINHSLEFNSARLSPFSGRNAMGNSLHGLSSHFKHLTEIMLDNIFTPTFPEDHFLREKEIHLRNLENESIDPVKILFKSINKKMFGDHHYSLSTHGSPDSIKAVNRDAITQYYQERLAQSPLFFTYSGSHSLEEVYSELNKNLDGLKFPSKKSSLKKIQYGVNTYTHHDLGKEQTHLFIGFPGSAFHEDNDLYLRIFTEVLSGQSSILFTDIRDTKGLCYSVQPIHFSGLEGGYWGIYIGTSKDKAPYAYESLMDILANFQKKGLAAKDFSKVKNSMLGQSQMALQTNEDFASTHAINVFHDFDLDMFYKKLARIQTCKIEKVNAFLKKLLNKKPVVVTCGEKAISI